MKKLFLTCVCAGVFVASSAWALDPWNVYKQAAPAGCLDNVDFKKVLDLSTLVQIGICNNPSLSKDFMDVKAAEASLGGTKAAYLPTIDTTHELGKSHVKVENQGSASTDPYKGNIALQWLLYDFGGRSAQTEQTTNYLQVASFTYNATLHDTVLAIHQAYFDLLSNQEVLKSAKETVKSYKKSYEETSKRYELGMVSLSDKLLAKTTYQKSELGVITAKNAIEKASANLATLLNLPTDTTFKLQKPKKGKDITKLEKDMPVQEMMTTAVALRPELKGALSSQEAAKQGVYIARAGHFPKIYASAGIEYDDYWKDSVAYQRKENVGVSVSVPLFSGFATSYAVDQARYNYDKAQSNVVAVEDNIKEEVFTAYHDYLTSVSSYKVNQQVLESAKESERVSFASYQAGKESILNLLTAQAQLASSRKELVVSFYNVLISKANLYRAIGQF